MSFEKAFGVRHTFPAPTGPMTANSSPLLSWTDMFLRVGLTVLGSQEALMASTTTQYSLLSQFL